MVTWFGNDAIKNSETISHTIVAELDVCDGTTLVEPMKEQESFALLYVRSIANQKSALIKSRKRFDLYVSFFFLPRRDFCFSFYVICGGSVCVSFALSDPYACVHVDVCASLYKFL